MAEEKEEKKSFRVIDKRGAAQTTEKKVNGGKKPQAQEREAQKEARAEQPPPVPEITFSAFVYSLSTSALVHLGEIPEPISEKMDKNLPLAKQTIDILGLLQEKTKGNLTQEEENLLNSFLYDLRMRYVKAMG